MNTLGFWSFGAFDRGRSSSGEVVIDQGCRDVANLPGMSASMGDPIQIENLTVCLYKI